MCMARRKSLAGCEGEYWSVGVNISAEEISRSAALCMPQVRYSLTLADISLLLPSLDDVTALLSMLITSVSLPATPSWTLAPRGLSMCSALVVLE